MIRLIEKLQEVSINEATLRDIKRKQNSITRLFPSFFDRVEAVVDKGGIRLKDIEKEYWVFNIHSGTKDDVWYTAYLRFKNIVPLVEILVKDRRLWNRDRTKINYNKLANEFIRKVDLKVDCSCPAQLYWGQAYILSRPKYDAKFGDPENRSPRIRNPKQYGAVCKHLQTLLKVFPFYGTTIINWLKRFYGNEIARFEKEIKKEAFQYKKAAAFLGKRQEELSKQKESEEGLPASD